MVRFILLALSALFISCDALNLGEGNLNTDLDLKSTDIARISDIDATFTVRNGTNKTQEYNFNSGCQAFYSISKDGKKVFHLEENVGCIAILTSLKLEPDESETFELSTDIFDVSLSSGQYMLKAYLIGYEDEVFAEETFTVE